MEGGIYNMAQKEAQIFCHNLHRISDIFITDNLSLMFGINIFFMESALCTITVQSAT